MNKNESEKLPVELLIKIFSYASGLCGRYYLDTQTTGHYAPKLHIMAQVCRQWLEIIKAAPELWTFVTDRDPKNAIVALDRSKSHPVGIGLREVPFNGSLYAVALNNSQRWVRADIRFSPSDQLALHELAEVSVPILQRLQLEFFYWDEDTVFVSDLFRDHPPRLTSLDLIQVAIRQWNSPIFGPHLHSLKLTRLRTSNPTREDLWGIFHACPELNHLELTHVNFSGEMPQGPRVQLPLLAALLLRPLSPSDAVDIARMIETPRCRHYSVSRGLETPDALALSAVALQVQPLFESCIASSSSLFVHLDGFWIRITCRRGEPPHSDFKLKLGKVGSCEKVLDWLIGIIARSPLLSPIPVDVHLEYRLQRSLSPSPSDLLRLSSVRSLTIADLYGYTNKLAESLSVPKDLEDGSDGWLWPGLREVTIRDFDGPSATLLHMVKTRTDAAIRQKGTSSMSEIAMLEKLEVRAGVFAVEEFEVIQAVLGDASVILPAKQDKQ
ncbi:hypothetical protein FRB94_003393 [Tulasnella sp. JGI-2019a]|nr:hypothetical protein FRB93_004130 [Tulasnella sp. JGI-2019a]KAG9003080.1 hypothetical protein FRB94_003393 [Tulasnella sp. JGI-2019a]